MRDVIFEISEADAFPPLDSFRQIPPLPRSSVAPLPRDAERAPRPAEPHEEELDEASFREWQRECGHEKAALTVTSVHPVGLRYIDGLGDVCCVCLQPMMRLCAECESRHFDHRECAAVVGRCGHAVHQHCVQTYKEAQRSLADVCLVCRRPWELQRRILLHDNYILKDYSQA